MTALQVFKLLFGVSPVDVDGLFARYEGPRILSRAGQRLFEVGDPATEVFVLLSGDIQLRSGDASDRAILRLLGPALVGDSDIFTKAEFYGYQARCISACHLLLLPATVLDSACLEPEYGAWQRDLARRFQSLVVTAGFEQETLEIRLLKLLVDRGHKGDLTLPGDDELAKHLVVSADRIGRARRAVLRKGWLNVDGGQVAVSHPEFSERELPALQHRIDCHKFL